MNRPETATQAYTLANDPAPVVRWYSSSCGKIELALTLEDARAGYHSGDCEADVEALMAVPYIMEQLARISGDVAADVARESGRCDYGHDEDAAEKLADRHANLRWVLWQACGDIVEGETE